MIPAFQDAKNDRDLRGAPMTVYLHLLDMLHPMEWREVKQLALGSELGVSDRHLRRALDTLTARGYLERQPIQPSSPRLYRLVYSRIP
jgi:DNA-binding GntR family transcriptional regulator